jgi:hypothetical protein
MSNPNARDVVVGEVHLETTLHLWSRESQANGIQLGDRGVLTSDLV